ncbi:MAG: transcription elongation factor GreA [Halopseudomonas sp.]
MIKVPMTVQGEQALRQELQQLKTVDRPRIIKDIATAREHGDLKENAEYHAAREQQGFCEGRVKQIESDLAGCQVIDVTQIPHSGRVIFGTTVDIINLDTEDAVTYQIVGDSESDIKQKKISVNSPIARALIGKEEGEVVVVVTPNGTVEYEIEQVRHI